MIENSESFRKYKHSYRSMIVLYNGTIKAFKLSLNQLSKAMYKEQNINTKDQIYLNDQLDESYLIAGNAYELRRNYKSRYLNSLNEILLIRCISMVENYLIDLLKELFLVRKDLFHSDRVFEFRQRELLNHTTISEIWTKVINKETRDLHNQGFIEVKKYYKKYLGIDFNTISPDISKIEHIHEIRHLLVHRLGITDEQYRMKYSLKEKNIKIDESSFREHMLTLYNFISLIETEVLTLINEIAPTISSISIKKYEILIKDNSIIKFFDPNYSFYMNEVLINLSDITISNTALNNKITMQFINKNEFVKPYLRMLKKLERKNALDILTTIEKNDLRQRIISSEQIDAVRRELTERPFPVDIHKTIATKFGWRNSLVYDIISVINAEDI